MKWTALRFLGIYTTLSLILGLLLLLQVFPWRPTTVVGWIGFFAVALPLTAAGEWLGDVVFENRMAQRLGSTEPNSFSFLRIAYGVVAILMLVIVGLGILWVWRSVAG